MAYFDGITKGDRVWDFAYGWGTIVEIEKDTFRVYYDSGDWNDYDFDGTKVFDKRTDKRNQTLFWDKINFDIPENPKIHLLEITYNIEISTNQVNKGASINDKNAGLARKDKETAKKVLKQIRSFTRLLALRDQECSNSRGYEMIKLKPNWTIQYNFNLEKWLPEYSTSSKKITVYFKTEEDAQKICDILNSNRFDLEGE